MDEHKTTEHQTSPNAAVLGEDEIGWPVVTKWRATFRPKRLDNLRPELVPLIGEVAEWDYAGRSGDDEPYPGQWRWNTSDARWRGKWVPDEDLEPVAL